ncbi:MAG: hypothetical protein IKE69_02345, partial [Thermoguttaceae bacterium]|nr:hypothetical protein [Thermoguttaceae bacterium]
MKRLTMSPVLGMLALAVVLFAAATKAQEQNSPFGSLLPQSWQAEWENPGARMRPLQIVHGRDLTDPAVCDYFRDECGLGGVVFNVDGG